LSFNSFTFLASFAVLAVVYYALPHRFRWPLLLVASVGFYATFRPSFVLLLLGVTLVAYAGGVAVESASSARTRTLICAAAVGGVLAGLLTFKYFDFLASSIDGLIVRAGANETQGFLPRLNIAVAAGLSFYTLSSVSYLVDVYRGHMAAERHLGYFTLYIAFFPKLLSGPLERARGMLARMRQPVVFSASGVTEGLQLMLWGLFKKVVIADRLAVFVDTAYSQAAFAPASDLLIATYLFAFQLYCDFSGYTDIAIGAARVLGFDLMVNFRRPYLATSVREFWSGRWHLSLSAWFKDYVYIPLGGSRVSRARQSVNLLVVFLLSGLWHGPNWTFVVWGGANGLCQVASLWTRGLRARVRAFDRVPARPVALGRGLLTFHLILVTWVFFRAQSLEDAVTILSRVSASIGSLVGPLVNRLSGGDMLISIGLIAVLLAVEILDERRPVWERLAAKPVVVRWATYYALMAALLVMGSWNLKQFVYMQF
jgi:D-alanyl-lipoteichoic acid acyltransferase DltB (MBOAT superfamily)